MSFKLLKYTQLAGFEEADAPFTWAEEQERAEAFKAGGYGTQEESEGEFGYVDGMRHHYHVSNGSRLTLIEGPCRWELVYTANAADHLALRIALAPLAYVLMAADLADIRADHGTLKKWRVREQALDRRAPKRT